MPGSFIEGGFSLAAASQQSKASKKAAKIVRDIFLQNRADQLPQIELGQEAADFLQGLFFGEGPSADLFFEEGDRRVNPEFTRLSDLVARTPQTVQVTDRGNREFDARGTRVEANPDFIRLRADLAATPKTIGERGARIPFGDILRRFDPTFDFRLNEGLDAAQRSASARGSLFSGGTLRRLSEIGQNVALQGSENFLNRLSAFSGLGSTAAANLGQQGIQAGALRGGFIQDAGTARASGLVAAGNRFGQGTNRLASFLAFGGGI